MIRGAVEQASIGLTPQERFYSSGLYQFRVTRRAAGGILGGDQYKRQSVRAMDWKKLPTLLPSLDLFMLIIMF